MSLHLGNLSSRVHRDELERVFRRFGRCNVQLKDGFGFVVYDLPANAEKALRALRGRNICGEPLTLSWSKRQPRTLQRFARGARSYETQRGRNYARGEDYVNRKLGSNGQRDYRIGFNQPDSEGGRLNSADMIDGVTSYHEDNIKEYEGEKHHDFREALPDEGGTAEPNLSENDRWGERNDPSNEIGVETGLEFDRYEPYRGDDKRDENEINQVTYSGGSPTMRKSKAKIWRDQIGEVALNHPDNPKSQQKCYICGELGHKMRNCPRENASWRRRLSRFDHQRANEINFRDKGEGDVKRLGSKSRRRLQLSRDSALMRQHKNDNKVSGSRKHRRSIRRGKSPVTKETHSSRRKDYGEKKRSRRENGTPERHRAKKGRGPVSSTIHSDYTASRSRSRSQSSKSIFGSSSDSKSRSVFSRTRSPSSSSRSRSISDHSRSKSSKSWLRSRSSSPTSLSLSVSIGRPLPSSPNKAQMNQKDSSMSAISPESKEVLDERGQLEEVYDRSDNSKLENMTVAVGNENAVVPSKVEEDMDKDHPQLRDEDNHRAMTRVSCEVKNSCTPLSEEGDFTTGSLPPLSLREMRDLQTSDALVTEHMLAPTKRPDSETSVRFRTGNSTSISSEELYMVLKHYGLDHPEENEKDLPVEAYFGSARLWPWEIIYYRRLRKGPISTENYAQRIAQNKEFGIVDKYIRSSSGWGELNQDNF
uniref:Putative serine/arginine-rich splicing factor 4-like n=1 Tax=Davidia involucrata TaxID=16924 RepID=A0A5B7B7B2_DAVIN